MFTVVLIINVFRPFVPEQNPAFDTVTELIDDVETTIDLVVAPFVHKYVYPGPEGFAVNVVDPPGQNVALPVIVADSNGLTVTTKFLLIPEHPLAVGVTT